MSQMLHNDFVAEKAIVHKDHPVVQRKFFDHTFELPSGLFAASLGLFTAFLVVMAFGFGNPELILPMAIFGIFFAGFYGIPVLFVKESPDDTNKAMTWGKFKARGIKTHTGHLPAGEAAVQMLILPVLILFWGIACVTIAALV